VGLCLGPYGGPRGGGLFLMSEVPLYRGMLPQTLEASGYEARTLSLAWSF